MGFSSNEHNQTLAMTYGAGITAALAAPLVMTIGFIVWENHWKGSAYALNLFKCTTASVGFLVVVVGIAIIDKQEQVFSSAVFTTETVGNLFLSSTIGILIGDWTWLEALRILGARRVILLDSLKPFFAAFLGWLLLGEDIRWAALGGIVLTVAGVLIVSLEKESRTDEEDTENNIGDNQTKTGQTDCEEVTGGSTPNRIVETLHQDDGEHFSSTNDRGNGLSHSTTTSLEEARPVHIKKVEGDVLTSQVGRGYLYSVINIGLDTYGSVLTKEHGSELTVWEINLLRFGFSGSVMIVLSCFMFLFERQQQTNSNQKTTSCGSKVETDTHQHRRIEDSVLGETTENNQSSSLSAKEGTREKTPWFLLPAREMTGSSWLHVTAGVGLVTFATPSLSNYALFQIALALALTLGSIGPIYSLPLSLVLRGQREVKPNDGEQSTATEKNDQPITGRSIAGAFLAVAGVAVLSIWGSLPSD